MKRIGIIGYTTSTKSNLIEKLIKKLRIRFNSNFEIITLNNDSLIYEDVKNICTLYQVKYKEVIPYHKKWNPYSIDAPFYFGRPYSPKNFWIQNSKFVKRVDYCVIFNENENKIINNIQESLKSNKKKYILL